MIKLVVTNEKNLELYELEKVHVGENKFGYYLIFLPEVLNGFALSECNVELVQVLADNTSVSINIDTTQQIRPIQENITLDVTATAQTVTLSMLITRNGDIIGKTNQVTFEVHPTKNATPIDPREDLDEIIAELRADNAQLEETVSEQATQISEKNTLITELSGEVAELNGEVTELETENTRLENLTETQRQTIQYTIDNPPQPRLETPDIIVPESETKQYTPSPGYDGFANFIVKGTDELNIDLQHWINNDNPSSFSMSFNKNIRPYCAYGQSMLNEISFSSNVTSVGEGAFCNCGSLNRVNFSSQNNIIALSKSMFNSCTALSKITIPDNVTYIDENCFAGSGIVSLVIPHGVVTIKYAAAFRNMPKLISVWIPNTIETDFDFNYSYRLSSIELEDGFNVSLSTITTDFYTLGVSVDMLLRMINALSDRTGQAARTLTIGQINLKKLTNEQKAIAINKNWNLN